MKSSFALGLLGTLLMATAGRADYPATYVYDPYVRNAIGYEEVVTPVEQKVQASVQPRTPLFSTPRTEPWRAAAGGGTPSGAVPGGLRGASGFSGAKDSCSTAARASDPRGGRLASGPSGSLAGQRPTGDPAYGRLPSLPLTDSPAWANRARDADVDWESGFKVTFSRCLIEYLRWGPNSGWLDPREGSTLVLDPTASWLTKIDPSDDSWHHDSWHHGYAWHNCESVDGRSSSGRDGNHLPHPFAAGREDGWQVGLSSSSSPWTPGAAETTGASLLAEIDWGVGGDFCHLWSAFAARRANRFFQIVSRSDDQLPPARTDIPGGGPVDFGIGLTTDAVMADQQFQF
ncbi:MAG: hypothetical protein GTO03_12745 [Planctomycetales bacterium]|nr:hypothetical protein [Planctomycetales bacterium]